MQALMQVVVQVLMRMLVPGADGGGGGRGDDDVRGSVSLFYAYLGCSWNILCTFFLKKGSRNLNLGSGPISNA